MRFPPQLKITYKIKQKKNNIFLIIIIVIIYFLIFKQEYKLYYIFQFLLISKNIFKIM